MTTTNLNSGQMAVKNWWISILLGILYLFAGFWVMKTPLESYITLSIIFSVLIFLSGVIQIAFSFSNKNKMKDWGWYLLGGFIDLIIGILLLTHPLMTMAILPLYIGFWLLFQSILSIGLSFQLKSVGTLGWGMLLFWSLITLLFSFLLLANPLFTGLSIVYVTAFALITAGCFRIFLGIHLKKVGKVL
ncbi:HdeD family acid-resistance protein [Algibacter sp. L4_22]|uniref:HdeD family acid-resistance protein n=1 Tax=Algibacter sp. L4_22 TaxID=2942477 RepID=UPI00201B606A|nr:DUF308 domain-containing protein [Algibacter sp. L4_22]MCL5129317.1 DUF308 domain-containing protein [Algibacter sp. L4_22]